ncbi:electron transfer flavoprotein beta subunit lysine methyltransferase-like [Xylocopa sonorina]|uniref:electron transfer flavoprotein beta subunit lysine methyltransferase-like n=1 Tax=Xylocopa sonorina TaxID=1818115 RepID=UPI00403B2F70
MTPEVQLCLLTPSCELYNAPFEQVSEEGEEMKRRVFSEPFWSIYWPGGQALTRFVLDEARELVSSSEKIVDVGAGCGATAIAAKLIGARRVVANDIDEVACTAISMNAALNHVDIEVSDENLLRRPPDKLIDVIFIGDMLYDEEIAGVLIPWLEEARRNGSRIYLGDPGRHGLTGDLRKRLRICKRYSLPENVRKENYGYDRQDASDSHCSLVELSLRLDYVTLDVLRNAST